MAAWRKTPLPDGEGEFVSDDPFFDIDEITQTVKLYSPGTPLVDKNLDGNPASRQRVRDGLTGNLWRRRLLVAPTQRAIRGSLSARAPDDIDVGATGLDPFTSKVVTTYTPEFYNLDLTSRASVMLHEGHHRQMIQPYADRGFLGWAQYMYDRYVSPTRGRAYFELPAYRAQAEFLADYGFPTATNADLRYLFSTVEPKIEQYCRERPDLC